MKHVIFALSRRTGPDVGKCESPISAVVEIVNYHIPVKFCPVFARVEVLQRVHIDSPRIRVGGVAGVLLGLHPEQAYPLVIRQPLEGENRLFSEWDRLRHLPSFHDGSFQS